MKMFEGSVCTFAGVYFEPIFLSSTDSQETGKNPGRAVSSLIATANSMNFPRAGASQFFCIARGVIKDQHTALAVYFRPPSSWPASAYIKV